MIKFSFILIILFLTTVKASELIPSTSYKVSLGSNAEIHPCLGCSWAAGPVDLGQSNEKLAETGWSGFLTFQITNVQLTGDPDFSVEDNDCYSASGSAGSCRYKIKFNPRSVGIKSARLVFKIFATFEIGRGESFEFTNDLVWSLTGVGIRKPSKEQSCFLGSIVRANQKALGESIQLVGTPFDLVYSSEYTPQYKGYNFIFNRKNSFYREAWNISAQHLYDMDQKRLFRGDGLVVNSGYKILSDGNYLVVGSNEDEVYIFDSSGLHLQTKSFLTGALKYNFIYDANSFLSEIYDAFGARTQLIRNSNGRIQKIIAPHGQQILFSRTSDGYFSKIVNPGGESYQMTYKPGTRLLQSFTRPNGVVSTFSYNSDGMLTEDLSSAGSSLTLVSNNSGILVSSTLARQTLISEQVNANGDIEQLTSHPDGLLVSSMQGAGELSIKQIATEKVTKLSNDDCRFGAANKITSQITEEVNGVSKVINFTDTVSGLQNENDVFSFQELIRTSRIGSKVWTWSFDKNQMLETFRTPLNIQSQVLYNNFEQPISVKHANEVAYTILYDQFGRVIETSQGPKNWRIMTYNAEGYLDSITNARNEVTKFLYDQSGRKTQVILPDLRLIKYQYDIGGNLKSIASPGGREHQFVVNAFDFLGRYVPPISSRSSNKDTEYFYNLDRQLIKIKTPRGIIEYNYSQQTGQLLNQQISEGQFVREYNSQRPDLLASLISPYGIKSVFEYHGSRIKSEEQIRVSDQKRIAKVSFDYNDESLLSSYEISGEQGSLPQRFQIDYNQDNQVSRVGDLFLQYSSMTGRLEKTTLENLVDERFYDEYGELIDYKVKHIKANGQITELYRYQLTRDNMHRVVAKAETILGQTTNYGYEFDQSSRLVKVYKDGSLQTDYVYDQNSNRVQVIKSGNTITASFDAQDRILTQGSLKFDYSAGDEVYRKSSVVPGQEVLHFYDVLGNLKKVYLGSTMKLEYQSDGQNRRVQMKYNGSSEKRWLYLDQQKIGAELNQNGEIKKSFIFATKVNTADYFRMQNENYKIVSDHLGSTRLVVNARTGQVMQQMNHDEFGIVIKDTNPGLTPFGFAGGLYDFRSKLVRFGARDYDPETGRWMSKDPILFAGGDTNLYGYVGGDPVNFVDPSGLVFQEIIADRYSPNVQLAIGSGLAALGAFTIHTGYQMSVANPGLGLATIGLGVFLGYEGGKNINMARNRGAPEISIPGLTQNSNPNQCSSLAGR